jgi:hypothetical protein
MRNFIVLGASALVLTLGVAQASAIPTTGQWQEHLDRMSLTASPTANGDFAGFRAQAVDQVQDQSPSLYHRGR